MPRRWCGASTRSRWSPAGSGSSAACSTPSASVDPGLIPLFDRTGRANVGHALETAVLVELERRRFDVTYVRTPEGYEVDFLARRAGGSMELVQVCADLSDPETAYRELRALAAAGARFPRARQRLLTLTRDGIPDELPAGVEAQPTYEWLLTPPDLPSA